jgi:hypothetical protein
MRIAIKILFSLAYPVLLYLEAVIAGFKSKSEAESLLRSKKRWAFRLMELAWLAFTLLVLSLISGEFRRNAILLICGIYVLTSSVAHLVLSRLGLTLPETKKELFAISMAWGIVLPKWPLAALFATMPLQACGMLWAIWALPRGTAEAGFFVFFFGYAFEQIYRGIFEGIVAWPMIASEYVPEFVRTEGVIRSFFSAVDSGCVLAVLAWTFPAPAPRILQNIGVFIDPLLAVAMFPLVAFVLLYLIPFYIGLHQHQKQQSIFSSWRVEWLSTTIQRLSLPNGAVRSEMLVGQVNDLDAEMTGRLSEIEDHMQRLNFTRTFGIQRTQVQAAAASANGQSLLLPGEQMGPTQEPMLSRPSSQFKEGLAEFMGPIVSAWAEEFPRFMGKDIRVSHLQHLSYYRQVLDENTGMEIVAPFKMALNEAQRQSSSSHRKKNFVMSILISVVSMIAALLWGVFKPNIEGFLKDAFR